MRSQGIDRHLYLASNSPRRKELFSLTGWKYDILPVQVDESPLPGEDGIDYVRRIARSKALSVTSGEATQGLVVTADTAVIGWEKNGNADILGKPGDPAEASKMLRTLRGRTHQVFTALAILSSHDGTILFDCCTTDVPMRNYSDTEIDAYVASGDPLDKAGAYAIQHVGFHPVEKMQGCYANVMGLPLCHLTRSLTYMGLPPQLNVPQACQAHLGYNCPVHAQILNEKTQDIVSILNVE